MLSASVNAKPPRIVPDMIVQDMHGTVGIVTFVSGKWVHVCVLVHSPESPDVSHFSNYHVVVRYKRSALMPVPAGFKWIIKQKENL